MVHQPALLLAHIMHSLLAVLVQMTVVHNSVCAVSVLCAALRFGTMCALGGTKIVVDIVCKKLQTFKHCTLPFNFYKLVQNQCLQYSDNKNNMVQLQTTNKQFF